MSPQVTPKSGLHRARSAGGAFEAACSGTSVAILSSGDRACRYLVIEGIAGGGAHNGQCSVTALPVCEDVLAQLLLEHCALEKERLAGDRKEAACLGDLSPAEIAAIPDRPTGLSAWVVTIDNSGEPQALANQEKALEAFLALHDPQPHASFSVETVETATRPVASFMLAIARTLDDGRTSPPPSLR